eukprot:jgi/Ulvmu1/1341/UM011_0069.1
MPHRPRPSLLAHVRLLCAIVKLLPRMYAASALCCGLKSRSREHWCCTCHYLRQLRTCNHVITTRRTLSCEHSTGRSPSTAPHANHQAQPDAHASGDWPAQICRSHTSDSTTVYVQPLSIHPMTKARA